MFLNCEGSANRTREFTEAVPGLEVKPPSGKGAIVRTKIDPVPWRRPWHVYKYAGTLQRSSCQRSVVIPTQGRHCIFAIPATSLLSTCCTHAYCICLARRHCHCLPLPIGTDILEQFEKELLDTPPAFYNLKR